MSTDFECEFCNKLFSRRDTLKTHLTSKTKCSTLASQNPEQVEDCYKNTIVETEFVCNSWCKKSFSTKACLKRHLTSNTICSTLASQNPEQVEDCYKKKNIIETEFVCNAWCKKSFSTRASLKTHLTSNTKCSTLASQNPEQVEDCYKNTIIETEFVCNSWCKKSFSTKACLKRHLTSNTICSTLASQNPEQVEDCYKKKNIIETEFVCNAWCKKSFSTRASLKTHLTSNTKCSTLAKQNPEQVEDCYKNTIIETEFVCSNWCKKSFSTRASLKRHLTSNTKCSTLASQNPEQVEDYYKKIKN
jgi:hypothetical protein